MLSVLMYYPHSTYWASQKPQQICDESLHYRRLFTHRVHYSVYFLNINTRNFYPRKYNDKNEFTSVDTAYKHKYTNEHLVLLDE